VNRLLLTFLKWSAHRTQTLNGEIILFDGDHLRINLGLFRYFNRDVECIRTFFARRFRYESSLYPKFRKVLSDGAEGDDFRLDVMVEASGFGKREMKVLEEVSHSFSLYSCDRSPFQYMEAVNEKEDGTEQSEEEDSSEGGDQEESGDDGDSINADIEGNIEVKKMEKNAQERTASQVVVTGSPANPPLADEVDLTVESLNLLEAPNRSLSRSPPQSRATSPVRQAAAGRDHIKSVVASDLTKVRTQQRRKYHSKRASRTAGRAQGSKAKQDKKVKLDSNSVWE
jgi:RIO kinase 2